MLCAAKTKKSRPPNTPKTRSFMCAAAWRPPSTAAPVHKEWPKMPPNVTPTTSVEAASPMVAICAVQVQAEGFWRCKRLASA